MSQTLIEILACPSCSGVLSKTNTGIECNDCKQLYPLLDGIPVLLPNPHSDLRAYQADKVSAHPYAPGSLALIQRHPEEWILDLGAGGKDVDFPNVVQLDIFKFPCTDVIASADALPFKDGVFSGVVSQAVFEHLKYPDAVVREIWRVCKPGAEIKIDTAFLQPEHGYPDHYFNATMSGLKHWFRDFDLLDESIEAYQHPMHSLSWFLASYLDGLPDHYRKVITDVPLGILLNAILKFGAGENESPELIAALQAIDGAKRRELAAGVSVLVSKNPDREPAANGGGVSFNLLSLESQMAGIKAELETLKPLYVEQQYLLAVKRAVVESVDQELWHLSREHIRARDQIALLDGHIKALQQDKALLEGHIEHFRKDQKMFEGEIARLRDQLQFKDSWLGQIPGGKRLAKWLAQARHTAQGKGKGN